MTRAYDVLCLVVGIRRRLIRFLGFQENYETSLVLQALRKKGEMNLWSILMEVRGYDPDTFREGDLYLCALLFRMKKAGVLGSRKELFERTGMTKTYFYIAQT